MKLCINKDIPLVTLLCATPISVCQMGKSLKLYVRIEFQSGRVLPNKGLFIHPCAPGCELAVALTPDAAAHQHFELPMPPMAAKITIVSEADTGAQGQRLKDIYRGRSEEVIMYFRLTSSIQWLLQVILGYRLFLFKLEVNVLNLDIILHYFSSVRRRNGHIHQVK